MVAGASLLMSPASPGRAAGSGYGGRVVITSSIGEPAHFNPAVASGSAVAMVGTQLFASPLRYDDNWNALPYLAESWGFSQDGLSLTLHLVKDAIFHDGRPVTSVDVAFSIETVQKHHPFKSMFAPVKKVETPDPHTAVIRLSQPHPAILLAMSPALLPVLPKHVYGDGRDLRTHPANRKPVGSGPFRLARDVPGKFVLLKKNDGFFLPGRPRLDEIMIRQDPDPNAQRIYMERQDAHILPLFRDAEATNRFVGNRQLIVTQKGHEGIGALNWLAFNLLRPPLDDKRVRQAIAHAIDPAFVVKVIDRARSQRATGPIHPLGPFYEPQVRTYELDLPRAAKLLDEAGLPVKPDGARFSLTLDYLPIASGLQRDIAFYIKRQLAKINIAVRVRRSKNAAEWAQRVGNWEFDLTMDTVFNWGDPLIGVHRTYLSENIRKGVVWSNTQNYRNAKVDDLLDRAGREMDATRRKALYGEFQRIVTEELPVVWLNTIGFHTIYNRNLANAPVSIWGIHSPLDELHWKEAPVKNGALPPASGSAKSPLEQVGQRAIALLGQKGLFDALEVFDDRKGGFQDLERSGLHVIGFTTRGDLFLDNSGLMKPGINISGLVDFKGNPLLERLSGARGKESDGTVTIEGLWPHPATRKVGRMRAWCGELTAEDRVCAVAWE